MNGRDDLNLIEIELARHDSTVGPSVPSSLAHQLETMAAASRNLEGALARERTYSKQLREYALAVVARLHETQKIATEQAEKLKDTQSSQTQTGKQLAAVSAEFERARTELAKYRQAWSEVLARDQNARTALAESEQLRQKIRELEEMLAQFQDQYQREKAARETVENHAAAHRQELQNVLVRLHSSEARYNDMSRELETVHTLRKNHQLELSRVEEMARERAADAVAQVQEQARMELERVQDLARTELARAQDQARSELERNQNQARGEIAREKERYEKGIAEAQRQLEQARVDLDARYRREVQKLQAEWESRRANENRQLEERHHAESAQRDMIIASLTENLKEKGAELAQSREETARIEQNGRDVELALLNARKEANELQSRIAALKSECRLAHDTLLAERKRLRRLAERMLEEWDSPVSVLRDAVDRSWLESLRDAAETVTLIADTPDRMDPVGQGPKLVC